MSIKARTVGSGQPDPQTKTTSGRPDGPATVDRRSGSNATLYIAAIGLFAIGGYFYLQNDDSARAKAKSEAQSVEDKTKELYNRAKSETKSAFGQAEKDTRDYRREAENRGQDLLDSAKSRATDVKKDAQEGWFSFKNKAGEVADDAKNALDKAGDRARSDFNKAEDRARSAFNDARSGFKLPATQADNIGNSKPWWAFGRLPSQEEEAVRSAGSRLRKDADKAESKASSWFTSAKNKAEEAKETVQSKL